MINLPASNITIRRVRAMVHGMDYKTIGWAAYEWREVEVEQAPYLSVVKDLVQKHYPDANIEIEE